MKVLYAIRSDLVELMLHVKYEEESTNNQKEQRKLTECLVSAQLCPVMLFSRRSNMPHSKVNTSRDKDKNH